MLKNISRKQEMFLWAISILLIVIMFVNMDFTLPFGILFIFCVMAIEFWNDADEKQKLKEINKNICPECRFPKRIPGHVFSNNDIESYKFLKTVRCNTCGHLPDYVISSPKTARIIFRNFDGCEDYFDKVKKYLTENNIEIIKPQKGAKK